MFWSFVGLGRVFVVLGFGLYFLELFVVFIILVFIFDEVGV